MVPSTDSGTLVVRRFPFLVLLLALPTAAVVVLLLRDWQSRDAPDVLIPMGVHDVVPAEAPEALLPIRTDDEPPPRTEPPSSAAEAPAPVRVEEPLLTEEERFEELYVSMSSDELERERDMLWKSMQAEANPILEQQLDAGDYEYLGQYAGSFTIPNSDTGKFVA